MATRILPTLILAALGGLVGLLINLAFPVSLTPGIDLVFGAVPVLVVALLRGWPAGLLAALIAGAGTLWLWGHPLGVLTLGLEALAVGVWGHRVHPALLVAACWLLVLGPTLAILNQMGLDPTANAAAVVMKGPLQEVFCALMAQVLLFLAPVRSGARRRVPGARLPVVPLRSYQATFVALLLFVVAGAVLLVEGQHLYRDQREALVEQNAAAAGSIAAETEATLKGHQQTMEVAALVWERLQPSERVSFTSRLVANPDLEGLIWLDGNYRAIYGQVDADGGRTLSVQPGTDFRHYRPAVGAGPGPVVQLVEQGTHGRTLIVTLVPARPFGYLAGYVSIETLRSNLFRVSPPYPATIRLMDSEGRTLMTMADDETAGGAYEPVAVVGLASVPTTGWQVQVSTPQRVLDQAMARTVYGALPTLVIVLCLMAALGYVLMLVLARDIREITRATQALGRRNGAAPPEADSFLLEMQKLQRVHRSTAESLARTLRELHARDAEMTIANSRLATTVDELKGLERSRSEVLNAISHDIKIPLTAVQGYAELLEENLAGELNPTQQDYVRGIMDNTHRVVSLLEDLLDLARLEVGRFPIDRMPVDVAEVLERTQRNLLPLSERQGQTVGLAIAPDLPEALADPSRLEQILNNLLSNAIKFTPNGGHIELQAFPAPDGTSVVVQVVDTGIGIAEADLEHLFDRFYRVKGTNKPGTGLGLAISKKLVEAMGGAIGVLSQPGLGSTFWFTLPLAPVESTPDRVPIP